jgi:hypothetical protein
MIEMASRTTTLVKAIPLDRHRKEVPQATAPGKRERDPLSRFIAHRVAESATSDGPNPTFRTKFLDAITVDTDPGRADDASYVDGVYREVETAILRRRRPARQAPQVSGLRMNKPRNCTGPRS